MRWDRTNGGVQVPCPQYFIHANVFCNEIHGDFAHSCQHGPAPHNIKVCITKVDNDPDVFSKLLEVVGLKPKYSKFLFER